MWEVFEQLLQEKGLTAYQVCKDLNISQGTIYNWKTRNNLISSELAVKIANYLNVSIDYLMTGDKNKRFYETDATAIKAQKMYTKNRQLFDIADESKPEDVAMAIALLERLRNTNKDE